MLTANEAKKLSDKALQSENIEKIANENLNKLLKYIRKNAKQGYTMCSLGMISYDTEISEVLYSAALALLKRKLSNLGYVVESDVVRWEK